MELYYYTTTDTLRYILENGDIFATNIRYMKIFMLNKQLLLMD